ncbi:DarT ssDNA thymidine ADP-ribosyltransferase family protein [Thermus sp.]|uniref:DarT ssDNA thymidine ADP-ribosyltransferase family protein n=1 Tax=Thermus sp. TaxID=275 RepID=UPI003D13E66D
MRKSDYLRKNGVQSLYHFTHIFNVPFIAKHGLLSKRLLRQNRLWEEIIPGGNEISQNEDAKKGNDPYVSLAYTPYFPMAYYRKREHHICFLEIDLGVVDEDGVVFTRGNATSSEHSRDSNPSAVLNSSDIGTILAGPPDRHSPAWDYWHDISQSEVLVPGRVDSSAVRRCFVLTKDALEITKDALEISSINDSPFPVKIDPKIFYDKPADNRVRFSYAHDLRIDGTVAAFRISGDPLRILCKLELLLFSGPRLENLGLIRKIIKDSERKPKAAGRPNEFSGSKASILLNELPPGKYTAFLYSHRGKNIIPWSLKEFQT